MASHLTKHSQTIPIVEVFTHLEYNICKFHFKTLNHKHLPSCTKMAHLNVLLCLLLSCSFFHQIASCKKIVTTSISSSQMPLRQGSRQEMPLLNSMTQVESNPTIRASSFMVDPLIIIALIALPTIGMLGLSSLIMPLIPIGIYLIQQFFPASAGRRRRSVAATAEADQWEYRISLLADNFNRMLARFNAHN